MKFDPAPTSLKGKTALVTGANGGIGAATAAHFEALGAKVLATDIGPKFIGEFDTTYLQIDLGNEQGLVTVADWIENEQPDILFNNAAVFDLGSILNADLEQFDRLFSINVRKFV